MSTTNGKDTFIKRYTANVTQSDKQKAENEAKRLYSRLENEARSMTLESTKKLNEAKIELEGYETAAENALIDPKTNFRIIIQTKENIIDAKDRIEDIEATLKMVDEVSKSLGIDNNTTR